DCDFKNRQVELTSRLDKFPRPGGKPLAATGLPDACATVAVRAGFTSGRSPNSCSRRRWPKVSRLTSALCAAPTLARPRFVCEAPLLGGTAMHNIILDAMKALGNAGLIFGSDKPGEGELKFKLALGDELRSMTKADGWSWNYETEERFTTAALTNELS